MVVYNSLRRHSKKIGPNDAETSRKSVINLQLNFKKKKALELNME